MSVFLWVLAYVFTGVFTAALMNQFAPSPLTSGSDAERGGFFFGLALLWPVVAVYAACYWIFVLVGKATR